MKKLGTLQLEILRCYYVNGKFPNGGWVWDNYSTTMRVAKSLAKRGLVKLIKQTFLQPKTIFTDEHRASFEAFVITDEGIKIVKQHFPNAVPLFDDQH